MNLKADAISTTSPDEPPTTYLWTLYFLAQHYSFLSQPSRALSILSSALTHTPTLPELYTCKGRLLKRAGDYIGAARCVDEARLLDGQDRFLNTKCAKYRYRAGMVEGAVEVLGLFTKVCTYASRILDLTPFLCIPRETPRALELILKTCSHSSILSRKVMLTTEMGNGTWH
jgi:hypothetical protein